MRLLIVSPDYLSHALPLVQIGEAWKRLGTSDEGGPGDVVVATGEATRSLVEDAGLTWVELRLGRGSNNGVIEADDQPAGEDDHLRAFFDATRAGPLATLRYQAEARRHDLLHEPDRVMDRLAEIIEAVRPDRVAVDHVAFGARLALHALGVETATVVLGHPSALTGPGQIYGLPPRWPAGMRPALADLAALAEQCRASVDDLAAASAELLERRAPNRPPIGDLTSTSGHPTIYVYPAQLHEPERAVDDLPVSEQHVFIGSLSRTESLGDTILPVGTGPRVTVALGSFLSARDDVLATAVRAAHLGGWRLALAHGSTPIERLGDAPAGALVARHLPQVAVLEHTDVMIHHGGNGSITEAVTAGVPMVVLPFSTDQFAGAAAIERAGIGIALAPNTVTAEDLVAAVTEVLRSDAGERVRAISEAIARTGGAEAAVEAIRDRGRVALPAGPDEWR